MSDQQNEKKVPPPPDLTPQVSSDPPPKPPMSEPKPKEPEEGGAKPSSEPTSTGGAPRMDVESKPSRETADGAEASGGAGVEISTRLVAAVIDGLVVAALYVLLVFILPLPNFIDRISWILAGAYWVVRDSLPFMNGQSLGKMAMKLRVETEAGASLVNDWKTAVIRNVALMVPYVGGIFGIIEAVVLLSREGKPEAGKRLGDEWAKTRVVNARPSAESADG